MKNQKKILIVMIILIICIIAITLALLLIRKEEVIVEENPTTLAFEDTEIVDSKDLFFQVENMIEKYMNYLILANQEAINNLSSNQAVELNKNQTYTTFLSNEMYAIDKIDNLTIFVQELARGSAVQDEYYMIINLDYESDTYQIIASTKEEFEHAKNNQVQEKYKKDIRISKNKYNSLEENTITDFKILKKYFDDYKFKAINMPKEAFDSIEEQYKLAKFNNDLEQYKLYVQNNIISLQDANIVKHNITKNGQYGEYIFVDNFGNYYTLKETGIYKYKIILDNYTLETDELKQKYNRLSSQEKAISNIDKIMKLINTKSYQTIYGYLNKEFKNNNFPMIDKFTTYMQQNFFDNNIVGDIKIENEGEIYILTVPYKESLSTAAEQREKTFVMKLLNGTNFELSFEI